jgi:hypothetical protein
MVDSAPAEAEPFLLPQEQHDPANELSTDNGHDRRLSELSTEQSPHNATHCNSIGRQSATEENGVMVLDFPTTEDDVAINCHDASDNSASAASLIDKDNSLHSIDVEDDFGPVASNVTSSRLDSILSDSEQNDSIPSIRLHPPSPIPSPSIARQVIEDPDESFSFPRKPDANVAAEVNGEHNSTVEFPANGESHNNNNNNLPQQANTSDESHSSLSYMSDPSPFRSIEIPHDIPTYPVDLFSTPSSDPSPSPTISALDTPRSLADTATTTTTDGSDVFKSIQQMHLNHSAQTMSTSFSDDQNSRPGTPHSIVEGSNSHMPSHMDLNRIGSTEDFQPDTQPSSARNASEPRLAIRNHQRQRSDSSIQYTDIDAGGKNFNNNVNKTNGQDSANDSDHHLAPDRSPKATRAISVGSGLTLSPRSLGSNLASSGVTSSGQSVSDSIIQSPNGEQASMIGCTVIQFCSCDCQHTSPPSHIIMRNVLSIVLVCSQATAK